MDLKTFADKTNSEVMDYLRIRILRERRKRKLSQVKFAEIANISLRTYKRFEQNCDGSLDNFINVLRAFNKLNFLQTIFIEEVQQKSSTPIDTINHAKKKSLSRGY